MVPLMVAFLGLRQHQANATSGGVILFIAAAGFSVYMVRGQVAWLTLIGLAAGGVFGSYLGARTMVKLSSQRLRQVFGVVVLSVGTKLIFFS